MNEHVDITGIVEECILQHKGGERFFDALDERIRTGRMLLRGIMSNVIFSNLKFDYIIVSGKFGKVFKAFCEEEYPFYKVFAINGSLRGDGKVFTKFEDKWKGRYIFIDDSFYSGTTMKKVETFLLNNNSNLVSTFVFYDGSKEKNDNIKSFYRYYK